MITRVVFVALFALSVLLGIAFVVSLGRPWRSELPGAAWLQAILAACAAAFELLFMLLLLKLAAPVWVWGLVVVAQDVAFAWRLLRLRAARAADRERALHEEPSDIRP